MNIFYYFIGGSSQDDKTIVPLAIVVDSGQIDRLARQLKKILVPARIPFVVPTGRDHTPLSGHAPTEHWFHAYCLGTSIDHQPAAPAGNAPPLKFRDNFIATGNQHRCLVCGRNVSSRKVQFIMLPMAAPLSMPDNLLEFLVCLSRKKIAPTHTDSSFRAIILLHAP